MKKEDLINEINNSKIKQNDSYEDQDFGEFLNNILDNHCKVLETDLDVDKHRWYETSLVVYEYSDSRHFSENYNFGIRFVSNTYDEMSTYEDIGWELKAFPMKKVETVTYKIDN